MQDTIAFPKDLVDRIAHVISRLVAQVEPKDTEAKKARCEAEALVQDVAHLAEEAFTNDVNEAMQQVRAERKSAHVLLELAEKAEREGLGSGLGDLAQNHDAYAAAAIDADLKRIHDDNR